MQISAVIITYNEESNLVDCLTSLSFCDQWIVVDSNSQDKTVQIAKSMGATVIQQSFLGHVKQKQFAVEQSSYDWVLCIDADERVSADLKEAILSIKAQSSPEHWGYQVARRSFHLGRWINHGGWYPDRGIRLFHKAHGHWAGYDPHDKVVIEGPPGTLKGDLEHYVFKNLSHNVQKNNLYSSIMANDLFLQGKKPSLSKLLLKPMYKFFECYCLKSGYKDGMPGLIIAVGASYSMFLKFAKLWELSLADAKKRSSSP